MFSLQVLTIVQESPYLGWFLSEPVFDFRDTLITRVIALVVLVPVTVLYICYHGYINIVACSSIMFLRRFISFANSPFNAGHVTGAFRRTPIWHKWSPPNNKSIEHEAYLRKNVWFLHKVTRVTIAIYWLY